MRQSITKGAGRLSHTLLFALLLLIGSAFAACGGTGTDITGSLPYQVNASNTCVFITANQPNVINGVNLTATNDTLDCDGFYISSSSNSTAGTYGAYASANLANISNCNIYGFASSIYALNGANNPTIDRNNVSNTYTGLPASYGIIAYTGANITNNNVTSSGDANGGQAVYQGAAPAYVANNKFKMTGTYDACEAFGASTWVNNTCDNGAVPWYAIRINSGGGNYTNNTFIGTGARPAVEIVAAHNTLLQRNVITNPSGGAVDIGQATSNLTLKNNTLISTSGNGFTASAGALLSSVINDSYISAAGFAIQFEFGTGNYVGNNTLISTGSSQTIRNSQGSSNNVYNNNTIGNSGATVAIVNSNSNVTFTNNIINAGQTTNGALAIFSSSGGLYANNTINANGFDTCVNFGLIGQTAVNNRFFNNTITNCTKWEVIIGATSGNNTFYWNNFTNTSGVYVNDTNGSNYYNTSTEGNFYYNVLNGSANLNITSVPPVVSLYGFVQGSQVYVGSYSSSGSYPYSNATSFGKVFGNVTDNKVLVFISSSGSFSIVFLGNQSIDGQSVPCTGWFGFNYNGTATPSAIFVNYTGFINYTNGTVAFLITNATLNSTFMNQSYTPLDYPNGSCSVTYDTFVRIYTTAGFAQTDGGLKRRITILNNTTPNTSVGDNITLSIIIGLSILALIFTYLHVNAKTYVWAQLWFFLACMMVTTDLLAMNNYAAAEGNTAIATVAIALFAGFVWVFIISIWIFLFTMIKELIDVMKEAFKRG